MENGLNKRYRFENFIEGACNRFALAAAKEVAERHEEQSTPLYIYGASGLGKTHLLNAIGNRLVENKPEITVKYLSAEEFTHDFVKAVRRNQEDDFDRAYESLDVLLVDDIQRFGKMSEAQKVFVALLEKLQARGIPVVLSADQPVLNLNIDERLTSRILGGLMIPLGYLDFETRIKICRTKFEERQIVAEEDAISKLAYALEFPNVRDLEGSVNRACFIDRTNGKVVVDLEIVEKAMEILKQGKPEEERKQKASDFLNHMIMVKVEIDADAEIVLDTFPSSCDIEQIDGKTIIEFKTQDTESLLRWLLGQGQALKVLSPPSLIEKLKREIDGMQKKYL